MQQILAHAQNLLTVLFAIHALALAIVNLTPTPKDNTMVAKYYRVLGSLLRVLKALGKLPHTHVQQYFFRGYNLTNSK